MTSTTRRPGATGPSAGIDDTGLGSDGSGDRMVDLEERLARLERRVTFADRGRSMMARVMPPEAGQHFRQAGREQLLGIRAIVDFWIDRIDRSERRASDASDSERIEIG